ncbi:MAG: 16S rRNA (guanine(527)-N(7))-methyltransferase RsmG [Alphaproteobacteria bacterium]|nr:16S rRNA (guanine(527)-N(7))-methyltransferase RsmG [Alphaproteobacteria bacterium]
MSPEDFAKLTGVSRETLTRLKRYAALLETWQAKINLVSTASLQDIWRRHILDAAQLAALIPGSHRRLVDIGSGAGLPGLILAILGFEDVMLIESDGRKCAFLNEAARVTGTAVEIHHGRIETAPRDISATVITARALAPLPKLLAFAYPFVNSEAKSNAAFIFLKGKSVERELTAAQKSWTLRIERFPSITDPSGTVLRITEVERAIRS